jgi:hypothetical protein
MQNKYHFIFFVTLLVLLTSPGVAQRRKQPEDRTTGRIEKFKTMRVIEVLNLNDEEAARFTAKQHLHDDSLRSLLKERNSRIDAIDEIVRSEGKKEDLDRKTEEVLAVDQKIFNERQRYYADLEKFFTPEQFAKFIIFDRNFNRKVRDAMDEMRSKFGGHRDD